MLRLQNYSKGDKCLERITHFHLIFVILQGFRG
jgi:hypothetical protein